MSTFSKYEADLIKITIISVKNPWYKNFNQFIPTAKEFLKLATMIPSFVRGIGADDLPKKV